MKRDRQAEAERILLGAESTLRSSLLEILPEVIVSGEAVFTNSQFNPSALSEPSLSKQGEALFQTATACVEMREALGLPVSGSIGQLFIDACIEVASSNEHRRGSRKLAASILEQLTHVA